jgi:hypothetical protein
MGTDTSRVGREDSQSSDDPQEKEQEGTGKEIPQEVSAVEILAWVGEDEEGSGVIGMKQVMIPGKGVTNLAATDKPDVWVSRDEIRAGMQAQADMYGKTIYLCRYKLDRIEAIAMPGRLSD